MRGKTTANKFQSPESIVFVTTRSFKQGLSTTPTNQQDLTIFSRTFKEVENYIAANSFQHCRRCFGDIIPRDLAIYEPSYGERPVDNSRQHLPNLVTWMSSERTIDLDDKLHCEVNFASRWIPPGTGSWT